MQIESSRCVVIKIGSALVVDEEKNQPHLRWLNSLITDVRALMDKGIKVVLVSSGAIAFGKLTMSVTGKHQALDSKQALAAIGQIELMHAYKNLLSEHGLDAAQIVLNLQDTENRRRYVNLRNTLRRLLEMRVVPVINENDSLTTEEIRFGDNDRLAARVAQLVDADTLVLLSDIDGFYTADPRVSPDAKLLKQVDKLTPDILAMAQNSSSDYGSGGMITKLKAVKIATESGCHLLIAPGKHLHPIQTAIDKDLGTWFPAVQSKSRARKAWLKQHLKLHGTITVDAGAAAALMKGSSLLPVGITAQQGEFAKGSVLQVLNPDGVEIARGFTNYRYSDLQKIKGKKSDEFELLLGYMGCSEAIHRNNLVLIKGESDG